MHHHCKSHQLDRNLFRWRYIFVSLIFHQYRSFLSNSTNYSKGQMRMNSIGVCLLDLVYARNSMRPPRAPYPVLELQFHQVFDLHYPQFRREYLICSIHPENLKINWNYLKIPIFEAISWHYQIELLRVKFLYYPVCRLLWSKFGLCVMKIYMKEFYWNLILPSSAFPWTL